VGEAGRPARPRVVRVGDFPVVEASRRASLVRVGTRSRRSVRGFGSFFLRGRSLWRGFLRGLSFSVVECGYPLFRYSTHMMQIFYLDASYVYNGLKCFCKCFRRMFQMFYLFSDIRCNCYIWIFQNKIEGCISLSPFGCLASVSGAGRRRQSLLARAAPRACGWPQQARRGRADAGSETRGNGTGVRTKDLASGCTGAGHAL
jgi:hypothetical protein